MSTRRGREVAYRLFATEYDDADFEYAESDEERAPNYVVTPTGARANRAFVAGVLTEITPVGDEEVLRARIADPTGAFVLYAGQYQPEALAVIEEAEPPAFLAVTGKARTFQPEDGNRTFTSLRPETITHVDADVRDHHVVTAAERTIERIDTLALVLQSELTGDALRGALEAAGLDPGRADGIALALEHYETSPDYLDALRNRASQALAVVAGERDEVESLDLAPDADADAKQASDLPTAFAAVEGPLEAPADVEEPMAESSTTAATDAAAVDTTEAKPRAETPTAAAADEAGSETETTPETESVTADASASVEEEPEAAEAEPSPATAEDEATAASVGDVAEGAPEETGDGDVAEESAGETPASDVTEDSTAEESTGDVGGFELDEEEREELESEFPTDFETGNDVGEAGEADIDVPDPDELAEAEEPAAADTDQSAESPSESQTADAAGESESEDSAETASESTADATGDLEDRVVEQMEVLDEGDGVERSTLITAVADETGADSDAVAEAIDDALMDGRCYAPGDDTLKPI